MNTFQTLDRWGPSAVGWEVEVWWPKEYEWYPGIVASYQKTDRSLFVVYDDGDKEFHKRERTRIKYLRQVDPKRLIGWEVEELGVNGRRTGIIRGMSNELNLLAVDFSGESTEDETKFINVLSDGFKLRGPPEERDSEEEGNDEDHAVLEEDTEEEKCLSGGDDEDDDDEDDDDDDNDKPEGRGIRKTVPGKPHAAPQPDSAKAISQLTRNLLKLKLVYGDQIRAVQLKQCSFEELKGRIEEEYKGEDLSLTYEDDEGDIVTIKTQDDLTVGLDEHKQTGGGKSFKILLTPRTSDSSTPSSRRGSSYLTTGLRRNTVDGISNFKWQRGELLGCGSFARVYMGLDLLSGALMAVKQVSMSSKAQHSKEVVALQKEIQLLKSLDHHNIVRYLGSETTKHKLNIFLEYCPLGSIQCLVKKFGSFSEMVIRQYARQIIDGLVYLHDNGILHRDIKGSNILVDQDGCVKLADFGCSVLSVGNDENGSEQQHTQVGTTQFMAPEVLKSESGAGYGRKADVWSVGITIVEMATGKPPWPQQANAIYKICLTDEIPPIPSNLSSDAVDFLHKCFQRDPSRRPDARTLLCHPFVQDVDDEERRTRLCHTPHATAEDETLSLEDITDNALVRKDANSGTVETPTFPSSDVSDLTPPAHLANNAKLFPSGSSNMSRGAIPEHVLEYWGNHVPQHVAAYWHDQLRTRETHECSSDIFEDITEEIVQENSK